MAKLQSNLRFYKSDIKPTIYHGNTNYKITTPTFNFKSKKGIEVIVKGWKKSGITGLFDGTIVLSPEDPFLDHLMGYNSD